MTAATLLTFLCGNLRRFENGSGVIVKSLNVTSNRAGWNLFPRDQDVFFKSNI
jgi:hypothetical protein